MNELNYRTSYEHFLKPFQYTNPARPTSILDVTT